uniref:DUF4283 domain-containing protein n=1 Tax=Tanacetum cinerariifolium TaxID=118510 RepID=A0A6L2NVC8_TANCI|nr:hypothetical protein [Tanacetum cinerariifolium]
MERRFLSQKGSRVRRGVKEKQVSIADKLVEVSKHTNVVNTSLESFQAISKVHGIHSPTSFEENMNDAESIRAISERFANTAYGFFLEKRVAYPVFANYVRNTWGKYGLVKSVLNSSTRIFFFRFSSMEGLDAMLENGPCYARALIEIQADVELKDNIVVAMPKPVGERFYTCNVRVDTSGNKKNDAEPTKEVSKSNSFDVLNSVENDVDLGTNCRTSNLISKKANSSGSSFWNVDPSSTSTTLIVEKFNKMKRLIIDGMATLVDDEGKLLTMVDSSGDHDSEDEVASVDNDVANFLDIPDKIQDIFDNLDIKVRGQNAFTRHLKNYIKSTVNTSGNNKKCVKPTKKVSNSNRFIVFNSVENDGELGTNRGTSNLASNEANSSGSSLWNVETSSTSTTSVVDKIGKLEKLIFDEKVTLVDDDGIPLKNVDYPGDLDSEDEVESLDNDMTLSMASERVEFGTKSLLKQWWDSYENGDYNEDPYNDDIYEGQDILEKIQDICNNLDIRVRGRKKK